MGLERMFGGGGGAHFGRVMTIPLSVFAVYHAVFMAVDEVGTEAAADNEQN